MPAALWGNLLPSSVALRVEGEPRRRKASMRGRSRQNESSGAWVGALHVFTALLCLSLTMQARGNAIQSRAVAIEPGGACSTVTFGPRDYVCLDECDTRTAGVCTCVVGFEAIPSGESCTTMCASNGMTCSGRHSDGPSFSQCIYFESNTRREQCGDTGDGDDICVCTKPSVTTPPTRQPVRVPTPSPIRQPTRSPTSPPTRQPTRSPTPTPTESPTGIPTVEPRTPEARATAIVNELRAINPAADDCESTALQSALVQFLVEAGGVGSVTRCTQSPGTVPSTSTPTSSPTTQSPTSNPTSPPTFNPTHAPTATPSGSTPRPTSNPVTLQPASTPTSSPTTQSPTSTPTHAPTATPSGSTTRPTSNPVTPQPTGAPTTVPLTSITLSGELRRWHKVVVDVPGPESSEQGFINPFFDYRMTAVFTHSGGAVVTVPGYFAADGNAAETAAISGTVFRAHLAPHLTGVWMVQIEFTTGTDVAVRGGGTAVPGVDGQTTTFTVSETNKGGADFRGKGMLLPRVGERYLRFNTSGERFLKAGADSPENLLAYYEFDGTFDNGGGGPATPDGLHHYDAHLADWQSGDPTWQGSKGKRLIGALNYLAESGANVFSFLTYNTGGDGRDVWPHVAPTDRTRYDVSKLAQWEVVLSHADTLGLFLHFKTQETENDDHPTHAFDGSGQVGRERRLYYRELVARFGHHLALNWNLGEENTQTQAQHRDMAAAIRELDPYGHLIVIHTYPSSQAFVYTPLLNASVLTGVSVQSNAITVHRDVLRWVTDSEQAGQPWVVSNDEQGNANIGIYPDDSYPNDFVKRQQVGQVLYGTLMAGGAGVEAYFGYALNNNDLTCEDWRSRAEWWSYGRHALNLFATVPFWTMQSEDGLVENGDYCYAARGSIYMVYHHNAVNSGTRLNLAHTSGAYSVRWFDPMTGATFTPTVSSATVFGGESVSYGTAPSRSGQHWVTVFTAGPAPPTSPTTAAPSVVPTTAAPSATPPLTACATIPLESGDEYCLNECTASLCTCAVSIRSIAPGDSCTSICLAAGMTCSGRFSDAASSNRCLNFLTQNGPENCAATGDSDDVCVCTRPV